jgi:hypothetical protein
VRVFVAVATSPPVGRVKAAEKIAPANRIAFPWLAAAEKVALPDTAGEEVAQKVVRGRGGR